MTSLNIFLLGLELRKLTIESDGRHLRLVASQALNVCIVFGVLWVKFQVCRYRIAYILGLYQHAVLEKTYMSLVPRLINTLFFTHRVDRIVHWRLNQIHNSTHILP